MSKFFVAGGKTYSLQSSVSSTQTTITLTSFTVPVTGDDITMALMNTDIAYGTIAPRTTNSEFISFTGITQNSDGTATLTGVTRGLDKLYPYTTDSDFKLPHAGATQFILSDAPQVFNQYSVIANDETITGRKVFPTSGVASSPLVGLTYTAPSQDTEIATKKYVDVTAIFGAPMASTATAGIVQFPTDAQREAGTDIGSTGAGLVLPNRQYGAKNYIGFGTGAGSPNTYTVTVVPAPTAYATGQVIGVLMPNRNTGTATLNVNGLGAKNIHIASTNLIAGAFATNSLVGMAYSSGVWNIIWANDLFANTGTASKVPIAGTNGKLPATFVNLIDVQVFSTSGANTWTKPTGANMVEVHLFGAGGGGGSGASAANGGGGGGGGGAYSTKNFVASALGTTETVTVGAKGTGGALGAGGNNGTTGGDTIFGTTTLLVAKGGVLGVSGASAPGTGGAGGAGTGDVQVTGGAGGNGALQGVDTAILPSPRGGGGGGTAGATGGNGGAFITNYAKAGGAGGTTGNNGADAASTSSGLIYGGVGGGGGGGETGSGGGKNGGLGGSPGGGGGGGGNAGGGRNGGAGGDGADGQAVVITYF